MTTLTTSIVEARSIGLTRHQLRYLRAVRDLTADGVPTTHRGVAVLLGVQCGGVYQMLTRLQRDGWVTFRRGQSRTIRLTPDGEWAAGLTAKPSRRRAIGLEDLAGTATAGS
jgi:Mn-dependent DtxR family transcriptional regulator